MKIKINAKLSYSRQCGVCAMSSAIPGEITHTPRCLSVCTVRAAFKLRRGMRINFVLIKFP